MERGDEAIRDPQLLALVAAKGQGGSGPEFDSVRA